MKTSLTDVHTTQNFHPAINQQDIYNVNYLLIATSL